jgi:pimeloyl-ACP methyl ester carboxylesterase
MKTAIQATTHTIAAPGVVLTYDVREGAPTSAPPVLLIGSPMGAGGFVTLASHFADRRVVTYDPRGVDRSIKADPASQSTPDQHADDLHRVISDLGGGPVDLFANSGGAVNALALVARQPADIRILVAHEPPIATVLPDREAVLAANRDIHETYLKSGFGPAMAKFITLVMQEGEIPADYSSRPAPDPQMFGLPTEDDGRRDDPLLGQNMLTCSAYELDFDALRAAPTRIVIAIGKDSDGALPSRGGRAVANRLGLAPVVFPSGHAGFLGGEYGQTGEPDAFAAKLREVLAAGA